MPREPDAAQIIDVWTRTAPKYRRRAALLLFLTVLLFAGLCVFTYWLRTGRYGPWADGKFYAELMWRSFDPVGSGQITLVDFLLFPISVEQVPIQWVIIGLLLATLTSIPILVAILYRFPASIIFAAMVGALAAMPWLGLTILLGCAIASLRPLRLSFRYASALLGLIPVLIYFVSASQHPEASFAPTPYRARLAAPWVLAGLGSCVIFAIALGIARLINYRPGGIAPLLAVLFAVPVVLFHSQVGRDELEYRILEDQVGPGSERVFVRRSLAEDVRREATERWAESAGVSLNALVEQLLRERRNTVYETVAADREFVRRRCDAFLTRFQDSRYAPNVLYLKGRALDQRIDERLLRANGLLQFQVDDPRPDSQPIWRALSETYSGNPLSAFALHQMGVYEAATGQLDASLASLARLIERFGRPVTATQPAPSAEPAGLFGRAPPSSTLGFDPATVLSPARRLEKLIVDGRSDPKYGDAPLRSLLALDSRDEHYRLNLARLALAYPGARIEPRLAIRLARLNESRRATIAVLEHVADACPGQPVQAEALYFLGRAQEEGGQLAAARNRFEQLLRDHADSPYGMDARDRWAASLLPDAALFAQTDGSK